ncbi:MAG TPA: hypothetical protein VE973_02620 [Candidatus Limnocylindria bacterium]|nr:hypothetical protein [Candidatus Limnocylindria bacterium]
MKPLVKLGLFFCLFIFAAALIPILTKSPSSPARGSSAQSLYKQAQNIHHTIVGDPKPDDPRLAEMYRLLAEAHIAAYKENDSVLFQESVAGLIGTDEAFVRLKPQLKGP